MNRIAVVGDNSSRLDRLTEVLSRHALCSPFTDAEAFLSSIDHRAHDLALIDWNAPRCGGADLVKRVRASARAPNLPIIVIAAPNSDADEVAGLLSGADDYVTQDVCAAILMARVDAVLHRRGGPANHQLETHGHYTFDRSRSLVVARGRDQILTTKAFDLALLLFRNLHRTLARRQVMEHVWGQAADVSSRTLDTHICRVRTKLGLLPANGYKLTAVYGFGYRLEQMILGKQVDLALTT